MAIIERTRVPILAAAVLLSSVSGQPLCAATAPLSASDFRADANALAGLIQSNYAYLDELPGGIVPTSPQLNDERDAVHDADSLLRYAEDMITTLADHHALTGKSFGDDWAIVPSYADLWITRSGSAYVVEAVKEGSIADRAGIRPGFTLSMVDRQPIDQAVAAFWSRIGLQPTAERQAYAALVMAAGRRDRQRVLTFGTPAGDRTFLLDNLYQQRADRPALTVTSSNGLTTIRFNNSIGDLSTIAAFDRAMSALPRNAPITLDLTDTPSGGTTAIARAIMSWFIRRPMPYQMHQLPAEERETGVVRQWVEYVLPRAGKYHPGRVEVRVGRWTGSMGEGLAIGFMEIGKSACGTRMSGLKGAVDDFDLPKTGLRVKFPAERLYTVGGVPRHQMVPPQCRRVRQATD